MSDTEKDPLGCVGAAVLLALAPALFLYRGWALWLIWGWFAPLAWGALPWINAVGLCAISSLLASHPPSKKRSLGETLSLAVAYPLICLVVFGVLHLCGVRGV